MDYCNIRWRSRGDHTRSHHTVVVDTSGLPRPFQKHDLLSRLQLHSRFPTERCRRQNPATLSTTQLYFQAGDADSAQLIYTSPRGARRRRHAKTSQASDFSHHLVRNTSEAFRGLSLSAMSSYNKLLGRVSRPSPLLIAATASTLLIAIPALRVWLLDRQLSRKITSHETRTDATARDLLNPEIANTQSKPNSTQTQPPALLAVSLVANPASYNLFHDISTLSIPANSLPHLATHDLLTAYLQHTMTLFSRTPQAYALWAMCGRDEARRRSFDREWIESLAFEEGGLVCGMYRVLGRGVDGDSGDKGSEGGEGKSGWVCFGMAMNGVEGRLVVAVSARGSGGERVFSTETWMWVPKQAGVVMPMERTLPRFMHRLGSQWLLVKGTEWLQGLAR